MDEIFHSEVEKLRKRMEKKFDKINKLSILLADNICKELDDKDITVDFDRLAKELNNTIRNVVFH